ncbi:DoxX-like family protein [Planococcus shenhongbingii]|uniref:DoxX-like family protein n=1 Tax=Planococcus shenhongbingii TaxID=3058398 RepID=UPI002626C807|nr:DoxX-like family protein [Planococcus sp. N016]WKA60309.1 DoxX-like family protein [Planococcus sp. N016]
MAGKPIYVEIEIQDDIERIWEYSQNPKLHEQWDLRFTSITYNDKSPEEEMQTFTYSTKVMPGIQVTGWGESKGTHEKASGEKTSALHFGTEQLLSPIAEGKGYWKYIPHEKGTTFLTQYNYDVRFGVLGKWGDRLFRPVMGWGTALSFDVLKRWVEAGESPKTQYRRFFAFYAICFLFAFVWMYQGLVPKFLTQHPLEISMLTQLSPLTAGQASTAIIWVGMAEMLFACCWLVPKLQKRLLQLQVVIFPFLMLSAIIAAPAAAIAPFNVITLNVTLWILSIVGLLLLEQLPSTKSCKRKRGEAA